jgi:hypothetical protein
VIKIVYLLQLLFAVDSLPEFECLAIRIDSNSAPQILGEWKNPSVSLRKLPNSDYEFKIKNKKIIIGNKLVVITEDLLSSTFDYTIKYEKYNLRFELVGKLCLKF